MRTSVQRIQKRVRVFFRQYERRRVRGLQRQLQSRLCDAPDILHLSHIHIKRHTCVFFMVAVYDANRPGLTGYGVPQIAAFQQSQTDSVFGVQIPQEPIQYFDGISPAFVYVISGMAACQPFHLHFKKETDTTGQHNSKEDTQRFEKGCQPSRFRTPAMHARNHHRQHPRYQQDTDDRVFKLLQELFPQRRFGRRRQYILSMQTAAFLHLCSGKPLILLSIFHHSI